jgi:hypothetical protein
MRLTVGPLPPAVYWRRRAIVLGAALIVLFMVGQACMSASPADDPTGGQSHQPTSTPPSAGDQTGAPATSGPPPATSTAAGGQGSGASEAPDGDLCTDDEIKVTALAGRTTFTVGESVRFTIRIAHAADRPCERDVGGGQRELYLVPDPGTGRVWSSRDCASPSGEDVLRLTAGWSRDHEIQFIGLGGNACDVELETGRYQLYARLGTARSDPVEITLQ